LNMKGIVVYDTSHGNTKTIAESIAGTLKESGIDVDLFYVKDVKRLNADNYDFLVIGSPTRMGTMSLTVHGFLDKMEGEKWMNKPFAAFDTEYSENLSHKEWSAAEKIATKLIERKMTELLPAVKAIVLGRKGPLKEGEIDRTKDWAKQLADKLKEEKA
jgi:menaquinone-dependent protoporphyrinogen IX oxidase